MSVKVVVNSIPKYRVSIDNQNQKIIRTVGVGGDVLISGVDQLVELTDVDASSLDEGETVVYEANTGTFVIKTLPIVDGGTF